VTIGSTNCATGLVGRNDLVLTIPSAGGVGTVAGLFVSTDSSGATPCQYTVTETAVAEWTASFVPAGPMYTVAANQTTAIALTNTAVPTTTTTVAATTTTTTIAAATTTIAILSPTAAADVPTTPTMPAAIALPATGSRSTGPATYIGLALVGLGTLILVNRRRHIHPPTD
jgi:LPXTG-motif cell wall-anchored protein